MGGSCLQSELLLLHSTDIYTDNAVQAAPGLDDDTQTHHVDRKLQNGHAQVKAESSRPKDPRAVRVQQTAAKQSATGGETAAWSHLPAPITLPAPSLRGAKDTVVMKFPTVRRLM